MADCLVYWKEFWKDVKENPEWGTDYHTRSRHFFDQIAPGDSLWVVVSGGTAYPDEWRLLQRIVVKKLMFTSTDFRPYSAVGDPRRVLDFDIDSQPDITPLLLKLEFESGRKIRAGGRAIGNALQAIRPLTESDSALLKEFASTLYERGAAEDGQAVSTLMRGAGFGRPETNRKVEVAACSFVTEWYEARGWRVKSVEAQKCGFDLLCAKGDAEEHVEVKGVQGREPSFIITAGELRRAQSDSSFVLCVVTSALTDARALHRCTGKKFIADYDLTPLAYRATFNP
ncbi:MAG TPA: DUF3883 domain-containing protein [Pyrinomonadaceae bacterium]|jgi:hypothetical protein|nr:DUF3883 domain-containing protein [Pyrinomonadaceae bacterium]